MTELVNEFARFFENSFSSFKTNLYQGDDYNSTYDVPHELIVNIRKLDAPAPTKKKKKKTKTTLTDEEKAKKIEDEKNHEIAVQQRVVQTILKLFDEHVKQTYVARPPWINVTCEVDPKSNFVLKVSFPRVKNARMSPPMLKMTHEIHRMQQKTNLRNGLTNALKDIQEKYLFNMLDPPQEVKLIDVALVSSLSWHEVEHEIRNWFENLHQLPSDVLRVYMKPKEKGVYISICETWKHAMFGEEAEGMKTFM